MLLPGLSEGGRGGPGRSSMLVPYAATLLSSDLGVWDAIGDGGDDHVHAALRASADKAYLTSVNSVLRGYDLHVPSSPGVSFLRY
eukprot:1861095-Rhodomonas_salina.6